MLSFKLAPRDGFTLLLLEGVVTLDAWSAVLEEMALALADRAASSRVVIDMTAVLGYLGIPERKTVGALMAKHFGGREKVAIVVQAEKITNVVYSEAQRNGLDLRLFPRFDDAAAWVTS